jgi:peptidyl-prolyl cis-trans isomerase B (cyclophilin B)
VVFGKVMEGMDVVSKIENTPRSPSDRPNVPVVIAKCGTLAVGENETLSL